MAKLKETLIEMGFNADFTNHPVMTCTKCKEEISFVMEYKRKRYCPDCYLKAGYFKTMKHSLENINRLNGYMSRYRKAKNPPYYKGIWFRSKFEKDIFCLFDYLGFEIWYEPIRLPFDKGKGNSILVDFFLPECGIWIETRGHSKTYDIEGFKNNRIFNGIFIDDFFHSIFRDFTFEFQKEQNQNNESESFLTQEDIELERERYLKNIDVSQLSKFVVIKSNNQYYQYNPDDNCTTLHIYNDSNSYIPILVNIGDEWKVISEEEYISEIKKTHMGDAYYIYNSYDSVYLKYVERKNKIRVENFIKGKR